MLTNIRKRGFCILGLEGYGGRVTDVGKQQLQTNYEEKARGKQNRINLEGQLYSVSRMINVFQRKK